MEDLFAPTTRFRDLYPAARNGFTQEQIDGLVELELITGSSVEDTFLHRGYTWRDFFSWAYGKMVWISPDVFFDSSGINTNFQTDYRSFLLVYMEANEEDTSQEPKFLLIYARSEAHATVAADILLQLLPTCDSRKVR
jgi:hypothetical protein